MEQSQTRRAVLAGAASAAGAWAAQAISSPHPALAADPVALGALNTSATTTTIEVSSNETSAIWGNATGDSETVGVRGDSVGLLGIGVWGNASGTDSSGVKGTSTKGTGVHGEGTTNGVWGEGDEVGVRGTSDKIGVMAQGHIGVSANTSDGMGVSATSSSGEAVFAETWSGTAVVAHSNTGFGVDAQSGTAVAIRGHSDESVGVLASSTTGYALQTSGRLKLGVSGVATIPAGRKVVTVSPHVDVTAASFVLLTPKANIGTRALWYTTNSTANTIGIHLGSARSSATRIAWLLLG